MKQFPNKYLPILLGIFALAVPAAADPPTDPLAEFTAIADALFAGENLYFGQVPLTTLRERWEDLASATPGPLETIVVPPGVPFSLDAQAMPFTRANYVTERAKLALQLSDTLLRFGENDEALGVVDAALDNAEAWGLAANLRADLLFRKGLTSLRQAEAANCIAKHNGACCMFPLKGAAVHTKVAPAQAARAAFEQYLALRPADDGAKWLLNIVAMALGDYPAGVLEDYRIDPAAFASEATVAPFRDVAPDLGVDSFDILGGVSVEDFNNDGFLDLFSTTNHPYQGAKLFRNNGDGTFDNVSASSGVADQLGVFDCTAGDYDGDGDMDLYLVRGAWMPYDGRIRNSLLRNDGNFVFTDVTYAAELAEPAYPTQAGVWGDFNNDGQLDLYVSNESYTLLLPDREDLYARNQLYLNDGDGTFTETAVAAGVADERQAVGATAGDFDNDGWLDLYVVNFASENQLFHNNQDGTFTDLAAVAGVTAPADRDAAGNLLPVKTGRDFPAWFFDYDNDGWLDIYVTAYTARNPDLYRFHKGLPGSFDKPYLYRNNGDGTFTNVADSVGLARPFLPMGAGFGDFDMDGWLDVFLGTGNPQLETLMPNVLLRNNDGAQFQDVTESAGVGNLQKGHGVSFADIDNDGDQDIFHQIGGIFTGDPYFNALYENSITNTHFLYVKLVGTQTNRGAVGARLSVTFQTPGGPRTVHRSVGAVSSFGETPARQEIGLADATAITEVRVYWPVSGTTQTFNSGIASDTFVQLTEGSPTPVVLPRIPAPFAVSKAAKP